MEDTWYIEPFIEWWEAEQRRHHCGQFSDRDIAYNAWLAGIDYYIKRIEQIKELPDKNVNPPDVETL